MLSRGLFPPSDRGRSSVCHKFIIAIPILLASPTTQRHQPLAAISSTKNLNVAGSHIVLFAFQCSLLLSHATPLSIPDSLVPDVERHFCYAKWSIFFCFSAAAASAASLPIFRHKERAAVFLH